MTEEFAIERSREPTLGTGIHWVANAQRASELAEAEKKLVFRMQVSGNFAREKFT